MTNNGKCSLYLCGDVDQMLFRFQGARPEIVTSEVDKFCPEIKTIKLRTNYRSTVAIIEACQRLIGWNYMSQDGPYADEFRKSTQPRDNAPAGEPVSFEMYPDTFTEAEALAANISEQLANGRIPADFFVGARTRAQLGYIEGYLVRQHIPFINIAGGSFWGSKHVSDVIAYVRLAMNPKDSDAFKRIYNVGSNWSVYPWGDKQGDYCTHRFLGKAFLDACTRRGDPGPMYSNIGDAYRIKRSFRPGIEDLQQFIQELQGEIAAAETAADAVRFVIEFCYKKYMLHEDGVSDAEGAHNGKLDDLDTVVDVAAQYENIEDFTQYVQGMIDAAEAAKEKDWSEYVVLSTIHRLKGLERPIVYGVGFCEQAGNDSKGLLPHTYSKQEPPQMGVLPGSGKGRIEDELCVAFVLVSRAQDEVHLSGCSTYRTTKMGSSRFARMLGAGETA